MTTKERLHRLVEELDERQVGEALRALARLRGRPLTLPEVLDAAPEEDEHISPEEDAVAAEGLAAYRRGEHHSLADVRRELG